MEMVVRRRVLKFYGAKWDLADWLIGFMPPHLHYVEPCGGAASVLLQKPKATLEVYNDLNGDIVNFFRVVRDEPDKLIRAIDLTPWARDEYALSTVSCDDPVERARRLFVSCWMSMAGNPNSGWRRTVDSRLTQSVAFDLRTDQLQACADRLRHVQIENSDALYVIQNYDTDQTLFYFDPPYVEETRANANQYAYDWVGDSLHVQSAALLRQIKGLAVVSGYACPLYSELYEAHGWIRHDRESRTNGSGTRTESVWLSPRTAKELAKPKQAAWL